MKNNALGTKLLMLAVTLGVLAYFGVQGYLYFSDPLSTTLAYSYQVEEGISLSGYVVRTEQVLPDDTSGLLRLQRSEGERVSAGGTVATVYADQASLDSQAEIDALTTRIEQLEYAQEAALSSEVSLKLDTQIMQTILDYRGSLAADRLVKAEESGGKLRSLVLKRDYTYSETEDLSGQIGELKTQLKNVRAQAAGSVRRVTAPVSGLYSAVVDGYETVLTPESLEGMTPSQLAGVRADAAVQSGVGKLILGDAWYYAAVMSAADAEELQEEGGSLTLRFTKSVERDLPVNLVSVGPEENGRAVAVFRGTTYLPQLTLLRQQSAQVISRTLEGIRVPKETVRIVTRTVENEDGTAATVRTTGVYCVVGKEARFKPVEVIYTGDSFVLVRAANPADKETIRLRPGDEVIVAARDLYDGKVVA
ncbi:MAG: HlyD family efflux transporter periplasmic adaptor subunit [Oscillospiraceae bacterium]|nr:HlyD family efflux transporter periplasmic adaptor subunit [Oscillospiraceae bacterium]